MDQHNVQEAYLKEFCVKGRLWVHDKMTRKGISQPASKCTIEDGFQSDILERYQNEKIESPGIKALRKILNGNSIGENEFEIVRYWTALHIIRNPNFRSAPDIDYNAYFYKLIDIENKFSLNYCYCFKYKCPDGEYFITSDNPVLDLTIGEFIVRMLPLSPKEVILLSPINNIFWHEKLEMTELVNSMQWAHSHKCIFSNQKNIPISSYEQNIKDWNLVPVWEEMKFVME